MLAPNLAPGRSVREALQEVILESFSVRALMNIVLNIQPILIALESLSLQNTIQSKSLQMTQHNYISSFLILQMDWTQFNLNYFKWQNTFGGDKVQLAKQTWRRLQGGHSSRGGGSREYTATRRRRRRLEGGGGPTAAADWGRRRRPEGGGVPRQPAGDWGRQRRRPKGGGEPREATTPATEDLGRGDSLASCRGNGSGTALPRPDGTEGSGDFFCERSRPGGGMRRAPKWKKCPARIGALGWGSSGLCWCF